MTSLTFLALDSGESFDVLDVPSGIFLPPDATGILPVVAYDEAYATSSDTEGGRRTRSTPQNVQRSGPILVTDLGGNIEDAIALVQRVIESIRTYGGEMVYDPPWGSPATFDLESAWISEATYSGTMIAGGVQAMDITYVARPYGRLPEVREFWDVSTTSPLLEQEYGPLDGSVDALARIVLYDINGQARQFAEVGVESKYYDPDNPSLLLVTKTSMNPLDSASSQTRAGSHSTNVWRQTLATTAKGIASASGSWVGRYRVRIRNFLPTAIATNPVAFRVGWLVRGGGVSYKPWTPAVSSTDWTELDLGRINIPSAPRGSHSAQINIYAKSISGTPVADLDYVKVVPAEKYAKATGLVGATLATVPANTKVEFAHDGVRSQSGGPTGDTWADHPRPVGDLFKLPRKGGRIAAYIHRKNIDNDYHTPLGDTVSIGLYIVPRVVMLG